MAQVITPTTFTYRPDGDKSPEENKKDILEHMGKMLDNLMDYEVTLQVFQPEIQIDVGEMNQLLNDAVEEAVRTENTKLNPEGVNAEGKVLYTQEVKQSTEEK